MMSSLKSHSNETGERVKTLKPINEDDFNSEGIIEYSKTDETKNENIASVCHSFEYHHVEDQSAKQVSVFDLHLGSLEERGNQRPTVTPKTNEPESLPTPGREENPTPQLFNYHGKSVLPHIVFASTESKDNKEEDNSLSKQKKKKAKLYDYRDNSYLEQKRRARTRKRSEVDFEIGLKLSRFINTPYEGAIDKYSLKTEPKLLTRRSNITHTLKPHTKSADTSPVGSNDRSIHLTGQEKYEQELRNYFKKQRTFRRRSVSVSPPRTPKFQQIHVGTNGNSLCNTPKHSPPISLNNSPSLSRYRSSTFRTILNTDLSRSFNGSQEDHLPDINFNHSARNITSAIQRQRVKTSNMKKDKNKSLLSPIPNDNPQNQNISPASLRKRVLLNTSLPCGSPTFQRAMKGLNTKDTEENKKMGGIQMTEIPPMKQKSRIQSSGTKRPMAQKTSRRARGSSGTPDNILNEEEYNAALNEIGDKLSDLGKNVDAVPRKSILKNRRRSIDDLDIGTKKGLAMYLQSKQNNSLRFKLPT